MHTGLRLALYEGMKVVAPILALWLAASVAGCGAAAYSAGTIVSASAKRLDGQQVRVEIGVGCRQSGSATCAGEPPVCVVARFIDDDAVIDEVERCDIPVPVSEDDAASVTEIESSIPIPSKSPGVIIELSLDHGYVEYVLESP